MRQQPINKNTSKKSMKIIDERPPLDISEDAAASKIPVRTIHYVEVGDMSQQQIALLLQQINNSFKSAKGGIHYVVPIRNGKIGSDIIFEEEWLKVIRETCEIQDNQIVMKNGSQEVRIIRQRV